MSSETPILIAGEPVLNLLRGLEHLDFDTTTDGVVQVNAHLSGEIAESWQRAIERYGADFIGSENVGDIAGRHGQAFLAISRSSRLW